jgi:hypothetical protein
VKALILLTSLLAPLASAQTTNTNCTVLGNNVDCTSTTDNSQQQQQQRQQQQQQQQAQQQAERDKQNYETGKALGNAIGASIARTRARKEAQAQLQAYCAAHQGESWARRDAEGTMLAQGVCPGTLSRQQVIDALNKSFQAQNVVGYVEVNGDTFMMHSERASEMRFHMVLDQQISTLRTIGIKTFVYTNDKDQHFEYDVVAGHAVTPSTPAGSDMSASEKAYCYEVLRKGTVADYLACRDKRPVAPSAATAAAPTATPEVKTVADPRIKSVQTPASVPTQSFDDNMPSAPAPVAPKKLCNNSLMDKEGHEVCLDQH